MSSRPPAVTGDGHPTRLASQGWGGVVALALAAFVFNTSEFVPVGLLADIGASFGEPDTRVGLMLTIYAWVVALASLPLMLLTRRIERRGLLMGVFGLFVAAHLVCVLATSFPMLIAGRIGIAFSHAVFWSITASLAVRIAPAGRQTQALGLLAAGTSIAMVLGIPLGRVVGHLVGWRATFFGIGVAALLIMLALRLLLPRLPAHNVGSLANLPMLFRRRVLVALYLLTIAVVTGHFTAYSYIEPFTARIAGLSGNDTTTLLLVFGGMGIPATVLFGRLYARHSNLMFLGAITTVAACLALLLAASSHFSAMLVLCAAWGLAMILFGLSMQARVLERAPEATDVAMSIFSAIYNVGIGAGALLGSVVGSQGGLAQIGRVGGTLAAVGIVIAIYVVRRRPDVGIPVAPDAPRPHPDAPPGEWQRWNERQH